MINITRTLLYFNRTSFSNFKFKVQAFIFEKSMKKNIMLRNKQILMQISCFSHLSLKLFAYLKHIFRMLKINVKNTYNHLIKFEKRLSWSLKHFLLMFFVYCFVHRFVHLAEVLFERLINCSISSSIINHSSAQIQKTHVAWII